MIISKKIISLQQLEFQVLDQCPADKSMTFQDGFIECVDRYFQDLAQGGNHLNLQIILEGTFGTLDYFCNCRPYAERKEYWMGVMDAIEKSNSILGLAFA